MAGSTILETAVNEVIDRMRRLESCIASLSLNSSNAQHNQFNVINQVNVQIQQLQIEQRCMFGSMQTDQRTLFETLHREMSEQSRSPLINGTIPATQITTAMQPEIKEPSPDNACGFPDCNFRALSKRPCSALQSLRHMVTCSFCPESKCRFLSIAQHMLTKRAPRVTHVQDCCWCGCGFTDLLKDIDSADHRVRHRKSCLAATIVRLQSDADHDETVSRLTDIWSTELHDADVASPPSFKRVREPPFSPIAATALNFADNIAALNAFANDDPLLSVFADDD
jgi:hypothetical protein